MRYILATFLFLIPPVQAQEVVLGLSKDEIGITAFFDGSEILIFGAIKHEKSIEDELPLEVAITIASPRTPTIVRRKEKKFGIWTNVDAVEVDLAPQFYAIATTAPFDKVISSVEDQRHKISIGSTIRSVGAPMHIQDAIAFSQALVRIRKQKGLYQLLENSVKLEQQTLFSTSVRLPANLTEGLYKARIFVTRDGQIISQYQTNIDVRKVGLERWLYNLAQQQPFLYGLLSLGIAIVAGWLASAAFRFFRA